VPAARHPLRNVRGGGATGWPLWSTPRATSPGGVRPTSSSADPRSCSASSRSRRLRGHRHQLAGGSLAGKDCSPHSWTMSDPPSQPGVSRTIGVSRVPPAGWDRVDRCPLTRCPKGSRVRPWCNVSSVSRCVGDGVHQRRPRHAGRQSSAAPAHSPLPRVWSSRRCHCIDPGSRHGSRAPVEPDPAGRECSNAVYGRPLASLAEQRPLAR
jgi:hypothetical protein